MPQDLLPDIPPEFGGSRFARDCPLLLANQRLSSPYHSTFPRPLTRAVFASTLPFSHRSFPDASSQFFGARLRGSMLDGHFGRVGGRDARSRIQESARR